VALRTESQRLRVFDLNGKKTSVRAGRSDGPYRCFTLLPLEPWSARLLVAE
jgi:hypothetical protein